jgi:hypothetical protein
MNSVLVANLVAYVLVIVLLTVVPLLPGMIMKRLLAAGLAAERAERSAVRG